LNPPTRDLATIKAADFVNRSRPARDNPDKLCDPQNNKPPTPQWKRRKIYCKTNTIGAKTLISHELLRDEGILILTPIGPLESDDFAALGRVVDAYIAEEGALTGVMIYVESFPGWEDFGALISHFKFLKKNQGDIGKVAAVTDSQFLSIMPKIIDHFVSADVRHFDFNDRDAALEWLRSGLTQKSA
jgi:hypothetical protein